MKLVRFLALYISALALAIFCFTVGIFKARGRNLIRSINLHYGFAPLEPPSILPPVTLSELAGQDDNAVRVLKADQGDDGNVSLFELVTITTLIQTHAPQNLFEIGTFDGRTTLNMAANAPAGARVYTLDLPAAAVDSTDLPIEAADRKYVSKLASGSKYVGTREADKIMQLFGDSATFDFAPYKNRMEFIFVDGAHSYEYVKKDSETALRLLDGRKNGLILWHDYNNSSWPGVTQALNELYRDHSEFKSLRRIAGTTLACLLTE
jgi:predicted O-methyltransferase YrrM